MLQLHCRLLDQQLWRSRNLHNRTAFSIVLLWRITQHLVVQASDASVKGFGYIGIGDTDLTISVWHILKEFNDHSNALMDYAESYIYYPLFCRAY